MYRRNNLGDKIFMGVVWLILTSFAFICLYPFYIVIINSFSNPDAVLGDMALVLPREPTLINYVEVITRNNIFKPFFVSVARTVIGTILLVTGCSMLAYGLTKKELPFRKLMYRILVFSMYISAGAIPVYVTFTKYGFRNNFLVYVIPGMISVYNMILVKVFIEQLPAEVEESAMIDGANYYQIFFRIILPVITPITATIATFTAVAQWNSWVDNLWYCSDKNLETLQLMLLNFVQSQSMNLSEAARLSGDALKEKLRVNPTSIRMAVTVITITPIMLVYPFTQRFFVKGIMIGAVKG